MLPIGIMTNITLYFADSPLISSFVNTFLSARITSKKIILEINDPNILYKWGSMVLLQKIERTYPLNVSISIQIALNAREKIHLFAYPPSYAIIIDTNVTKMEILILIYAGKMSLVVIMNCHDINNVQPMINILI